MTRATLLPLLLLAAACASKSNDPYDTSKGPKLVLQVELEGDGIARMGDDIVVPISDGWQYQYVVTALDGSGNESLAAAPTVLTGIMGDSAPLKFALHQSVPNPFNPTTTISYSVPAGGGLVTIRVFDVAGRLVRTLMNGQAPPGTNTVTWDGRNDNGENVATGIFFCRMQAPGFEQTMKMTLLK